MANAISLAIQKQAVFAHKVLSGEDNGRLETFLRAKEVAALLGIGVSSWWAWVKTGKAPQSIKLGSRTTVWRVSEIMALVARLENAGKEVRP